MSLRNTGIGPLYALPINVQQTATTAADATVWACRNLSATAHCYLGRMAASVMFQGTAAANSIGYYLCKFSAATPSSGTAITVIKGLTGTGTSAVTDARFVDTGLTTTSVVFETALDYLVIPISVTGKSERFDLDLSNAVLAPGEGLCLRLMAQAVVGLGIRGKCDWREVA